MHGQEQGLSQDFHNRVSKLGFQELRMTKIPEKVKIITMIMYFYQLSNYMLHSSRNVFVIILKELLFIKYMYQKFRCLFTYKQVFFMNQGVQKTPRHPAGKDPGQEYLHDSL